MIKIHVPRRSGEAMREIASQWFTKKRTFIVKERTFELSDEVIAYLEDDDKEPLEGPMYSCALINQNDEVIFRFTPGEVWHTLLNNYHWEERAPTIVKMTNRLMHLLAFPEFKLKPLPTETYRLRIQPYWGAPIHLNVIEKTS